MIKKLYILTLLFMSFSVVKISAQTYCTPTLGFTGATGDYVDNFTFATLSNLASGDYASDYQLYSQTTSVIQGLTYPFTIQTGSTVYNQGVAMWIDFDGDGIFNSTTEFVYTSPSTATSTTTWSGNVTIPVTASPGTRRLRVCAKYAAVVVGTEACGITTFGEYEDYNITIVANTPCTGKPTAGTAVASNATPCPGTNVTMSLTGSTLSGGLAYQWQRSSNPAVTWISLPTATNNTYSVIANNAYCYRCIVTCTFSGQADTSTTVCLTPLAFSPTSPCYCTTSAATYIYDGEISNVTVGTLNNTTDCTTPLVGSQGTGTGTASQYADFTSIAPPIVYKGLAQPFAVTSSSCGTFNYTMGMKIYVDLNHNTSFADAGEEVYWSGTGGINCFPATVQPGSFTIPTTALSGITRMRVINAQGGNAASTTITPCGAYNYGETEDYLINIIQPSPYDPAVTAIAGPSGNCFTNCEPISVTVKNFGQNNINILTNPVTVTLNVNGPNGLTTYTQNITTATTLNSYGGNSATVTFPCVDMYAGGTYTMNTSLVIGSAGGVVNGSLSNDSLTNAVSFTNYRPTPGPDFHVCQNAPIGFGQGLIATGCSSVIHDSVDITFTVAPCIDNIGATSAGTTQTVPGAACANTFACSFATATIPSIPSGAFFTQNAKYSVTNFATAYPTEPRFILYSGTTSPIPTPNMYNPVPQGYGIAANIVSTGISTSTSTAVYPYTYKYDRQVTPAQLSSIFANTGSTMYLGYWESYNDLTSASDITPNSTGATTVTMRVYYDYIPGTLKWYDNATSTTLLDTLVPFNPLSATVVNPTTQLTNTANPGTYTFFATCNGSDCRVPVNMIVDPTPLSFQDTISMCEDFPGSNQNVFNITNINSVVSGGAAGVTVSYYGDQGLLSPILTPATDTTSTVFVYSKVENANGCYSSDTVLLQVNSIPQFSANVITGFACAPTTIDAASLIYFPTVPPGTDTLYYEDPACTIVHPNPHTIAVADTVYIVFKTNTIPYCSDTAVAYIDITPALNKIANQDVLNYSVCGTVPAVTYNLIDGQNQTYYQASDCKKVAMITDITNSVSLGTTVVNEEISCSTLAHNGQPYVNRVYQITPTTQDSAQVCLYYLDDDINIYNQDAPTYGFPAMTSSNFCITKVDNGDINTPGHVPTVIPNSAITSSYDPITTVWTLCFNVDSFSYFYLHTQNPNNVPLPVNMVFTGKRVENTSVLKWTTTSEQNNDYFIVERSRDGRNFATLSNKINSKGINGNSASQLNYTYADVTPNEGHNYYRLQQVDKDGKSNNSGIVDVYFGDETMVTLYPNPVNSELNIDINIAKATSAKMRIMDATGRVVKQIDMELKAGGNQQKISMEGLADGMYMVTITNEKGLKYTQTIRKN